MARPPSRSYPNVATIGDRAAQQSIQQLWDRLQDLEGQVTVLQTTVPQQIAAVQTQVVDLTTGVTTPPTAPPTDTPIPPGGPGPGPPTPPPPPPPPSGDVITITRAYAGDEIGAGAITWVNSPPGMAGFAQSTGLTRVVLYTEPNGGVGVTFPKQAGAGRWPDVPFGDGNLQYTVGLVLRIGGAWYASAPIQYWFGLERAGGGIQVPGQIPTNWYYAAAWAPMAGYQPVVDETVGLYVVEGNARMRPDSNCPLSERTNIISFQMPAAGNTLIINYTGVPGSGGAGTLSAIDLATTITSDPGMSAGVAAPPANGHLATDSYALSSTAAGQILGGCANEFPMLLAPTSSALARDFNLEVLRNRMLWHLALAGFTAGDVQSNGVTVPGAVAIVLSGVTRYFSLGDAASTSFASPFVLLPVEIQGPTLAMSPNGGVPDQ